MRKQFERAPLICIFFAIISIPYLANAQRNYQLKGERSWETEDSKELAEEYKKRVDIGFDDHVIYDSKVKVVYSWDVKENKPIAEEIGEISVLALTDFVHYYDGLFQDDDIKVNYVFGLTSEQSIYSLEVFKKSYESASIFHQDGEFINFRLPDAYCTLGEIMKYKYRTTYTDLKFLNKAYLQKSKYIKQGTYEVWVPSWMQAEVKGYYFEEHGISLSINEGVEWEKTNSRDTRANSKYTVYTYSFTQLPKREQEFASPGSTHYMPHLLFLNKRYDYKGNRSNVFSDVEDLYAWYRSLIKGLQLKPDDNIKVIVDELLIGVKSDEEKLKIIFYWIQDNIRYIAFEDGIAGFKPEEARFVCANRFGDCKGMANLAKVMLTYAGLDARLTWLGTNHIAHSYDVPTLSVDNHMICTVFLNGAKYFIDPTEEYVALGEYATRIQGREVMIENGDTFLIELIPKAKAFENRIIRKKQLAIKGDLLHGQASEMHYGESRLNIIRGYNLLQTQEKEDAIASFLNDDNKNLKVLNIEASSFNDRESAVEFNYDFEVHNNIISYGDRILLQPDFEKEFYYFVFDTRKTPYQFGSKYYLENEVEIEVPAGFEIAHLPKNKNLEMGDFSFNLEFRHKDGKVVYTKKIVFEDIIINKKDFETWNKMISDLQTTYDDYVILKKTSI
ncbi:MAG: transglutaminase domain-containing protein [Bacteroidia bacterium]